ncbi:hypothetical protein PA598K_03869 [Paenibacillus sp. 598K]|uniref:hypothetical protein n=1 Tax=Paenibacillus sp. 598K TaxID=1117987 RepID=UPI000FF9D65A|nr:hypothetical protein [Paenibacillus sp. 598K]GBF75456.1 hypothetical protein PA598K_03869 [Paenibacillus sp. 598K]
MNLKAKLLLWAAAGSLLLLGLSPSSPTLAVPAEEETRQLLEKSLSVIEIDKEIERIATQREALQRNLRSLDADLATKSDELESRREEAGHVLRAYYTGEKQSFLMSIFSSKSLQDLIAVLDYYDHIVSRDKQTLDLLLSEQTELADGRSRLQIEQLQLETIDRNLQLQRARLIALQEEIDSRMSRRSDSEQIKLMMEEIAGFWESVGLHEVKQYFRALAAAMVELPSWLQKNSEYLSLKGLEYTIELPEDALNAFLREQNELFANFSFAFKDDQVIVEGKREGMEVAIRGHYTLEQQPQGVILFHVDELIFNGLTLPDTTSRALEEEFDLGFYPQKIVSLVEAKSVAVRDGYLIVKLGLSL